GIETGADLRVKSLAFLHQHLGKSAAWYQGIANGEDDRPVVADRPRKSSGSETTFERDLTAAADIEAGVEAMADDVWAWCDKAQAFGRTVTVKVKFADFQQVTRSRSFPTVIARHDLLRRASVELVRTVLPTAKGVRLLGVTVSNFDPTPADDNGLRLCCMDVMDYISEAYNSRPRGLSPKNRLFYRSLCQVGIDCIFVIYTPLRSEPENPWEK